jgi:cellulose synthase (UDP-forming)
LSQTSSDFVLVLDADFQARPNILWRTIGLLDDRVALIQVPQHYFSTDPIQHNLGGARAWTEEQRHFFDIVLPARDAWGNAVCVGTGFLVRRDALGPEGFPTGCLSEDVYLGYFLRSHGYQVRYLNEALSHGAAADSLPEYIRQRVRWCQGSIQFLWLPYGALRAPGLGLLDRLFYLEMPLYWISQFLFLALMLLAPAVYFWSGVPVFSAHLDDALSHVLPRIFIVALVTYWISDGRVMPIITEVKKAVGVVYILAATGSLVVNPRGKPFVPTLKGERRDTIEINWEIMWPFLVVGGVTLTGLLLNLLTTAGPVVWNEYLPINVALSLYGLGLLFLCCLACIDWPKDTRARNFHQTLRGRWFRALLAIMTSVLYSKEYHKRCPD